MPRDFPCQHACGADVDVSAVVDVVVDGADTEPVAPFERSLPQYAMTLTLTLMTTPDDSTDAVAVRVVAFLRPHPEH
jgi:hypothetical protein